MPPDPAHHCKHTRAGRLWTSAPCSQAQSQLTRVPSSTLPFSSAVRKNSHNTLRFHNPSLNIFWIGSIAASIIQTFSQHIWFPLAEHSSSYNFVTGRRNKANCLPAHVKSFKTTTKENALMWQQCTWQLAISAGMLHQDIFPLTSDNSNKILRPP